MRKHMFTLPKQVSKKYKYNKKTKKRANIYTVGGGTTFCKRLCHICPYVHVIYTGYKVAAIIFSRIGTKNNIKMTLGITKRNKVIPMC